MKKFLVLIALLSLSGCKFLEPKEDKPNPIKEIGCAIGQSMGMALSVKIAEEMACSNQAAINDDMYSVLVKIKVCDPIPLVEAQKFAMGVTIGSSMCLLAGNTLLNSVTEVALAKWECEGGKAKEAALAKLSEICNKL